LTGSIPSEVVALQKLEELDFHLNENVQGAIPTVLGSLPALQILDLNFTKLTGSLPQQLCSNQRLREIDVTSNLHVGPIPSCLGNLESLEILQLDSNSITGTIPSSLGLIDSLRKCLIASFVGMNCK
jgi:Leucine-rich repeat (LRR) protein